MPISDKILSFPELQYLVDKIVTHKTCNLREEILGCRCVSWFLLLCWFCTENICTFLLCYISETLRYAESDLPVPVLVNMTRLNNMAMLHLSVTSKGRSFRSEFQMWLTVSPNVIRYYNWQALRKINLAMAHWGQCRQCCMKLANHSIDLSVEGICPAARSSKDWVSGDCFFVAYFFFLAIWKGSQN